MPKVPKHLKEVVENLLKTERKCREDVKWLTYRVMQHYTHIFIPFQDFIKIPSFESVARCKRDIMNKEGMYNDFEPDPNIKYEHPVKIENQKESSV